VDAYRAQTERMQAQADAQRPVVRPQTH
jgi:hypothetical protein